MISTLIYTIHFDLNKEKIASKFSCSIRKLSKCDNASVCNIQYILKRGNEST